MKRFVEIAHTMSPTNFKKFFKYLTQIDLWTVVENNIYSILTRIHAELMQLNETQIGGIYYNCHFIANSEQNIFILFNLYKFIQMLIQSFINEYNLDINFYNYLLNKYYGQNNIFEISIESYLESIKTIEINAKVFENLIETSSILNNLEVLEYFGKYSKENDMNPVYLKFMYLAYLKHVDFGQQEGGQSSHYGEYAAYLAEP
uniref:Uncharacterized protein n=1 Tax=Meloidogyne enterolobii TaxID=390850 RepID=A0A6V7WI34_MELEN|nr:unnamed protein product [Meloidogyne enterolobii]